MPGGLGRKEDQALGIGWPSGVSEMLMKPEEFLKVFSILKMLAAAISFHLKLSVHETEQTYPKFP